MEFRERWGSHCNLAVNLGALQVLAWCGHSKGVFCEVFRMNEERSGR
jgi:hypothetical protein